MKVLPKELLDYIYTFTDIETVLLQQPNNKYLLNYFGYSYLQEHKKLHKESSYNKEKNIFRLLPKYEKINLPLHIYNHKKLETKKRLYNNYITLELKYKPYVFFNLFELKFYNPEKKKFNEIFDYISFIIEYETINEINNEEYINIINEIEKTGRIRYTKNNYTIVPLPFLLKNNYLVTLMQKIVFKFKLKCEIQEVEIYACTYDIYHHTLNRVFIDFTKFNNRIIKQKCISLNNLDELFLFNCLWSFIGDFTNIKSIVLSLNCKEIIYNIKSLKRLCKIKGYNFDYPTIIFDNIFEEQKSYINFNMIHKKTIHFICKNGNKIIPNENYKLIAINMNLLVTIDRFTGVRYSL